MSHAAREWVWEHSTAKNAARMILLAIADRCVDSRCVAYASVPALMKRCNAGRTAVRAALDTLLAGDELDELLNRRGPRGETFYHLPAAAQFLAEQAAEGDRKPAPGGSDSDPADASDGGPDTDPGGQIPTPGGTGYRPGGGPDSDPQNRREPKVNGKSSSTAPAAEWQVDDDALAWAEQHGHLDRLGEDGLDAADGKWRAYRAAAAPRTAAGWAADWRAWIARERTPATGRPNLYALPGGAPAPAAGMTRAEQHTAALLAALADDPTGTE
ncbi:helix-turn-helix domain-containing protein [Streptomyces sp. RKAG293]|uniref:helix-turn-helix domain-containing protein n=1 Tax=Streptomyces sp. RKAG293 TaxID=2893403 RepID=UPI002033C2B1|nr:helix-turn-helix domain-containing protein [Streptomyces sp. RKAG293]MCM2420285.1 helix-turn-helix domain-containing protein [Streptomyces sp. RKAG293]